MRPAEAPSHFPTVDRVPIIPAVSTGGAVSHGQRRTSKSNCFHSLKRQSSRGGCASPITTEKGTDPVAEDVRMVKSFS